MGSYGGPGNLPTRFTRFTPWGHMEAQGTYHGVIWRPREPTDQPNGRSMTLESLGYGWGLNPNQCLSGLVTQTTKPPGCNQGASEVYIGVLGMAEGL